MLRTLLLGFTALGVLIGLLGCQAAGLSPSGQRPDHTGAHPSGKRGQEEIRLSPPSSIQIEHAHLHEQLTAAQQAGGETGEAAAAVAQVLIPHFEEEEAYAMPPLGLLPALARGEVSEDMRPAIEMAQQLRANYPQMLAEHKQLVTALERLEAAATREGHPEHAAFAHQLMLHAEHEEQVLYPTTLLIGEYLKLRLDGEAQ